METTTLRKLSSSLDSETMASIIGSGINGNLRALSIQQAEHCQHMASIIGSGINGNGLRGF